MTIHQPAKKHCSVCGLLRPYPMFQTLVNMRVQNICKYCRVGVYEKMVEERRRRADTRKIGERQAPEQEAVVLREQDIQPETRSTLKGVPGSIDPETGRRFTQLR